MRKSKFFLILMLGLSFEVNGQVISLSAGGSYSGANSNTKPSMGAEGSVIIYPGNLIAIRGSMGDYGTGVKGNILSPGNYNLFWIEGSLLIHHRFGILRPYAGAGVGFGITSHEFEFIHSSALDSLGLEPEENIQHGFTTHVIGGISVRISPQLDLFMNMKYLFFKTSVDFITPDPVTFEQTYESKKLDLSTYFINLGISLNIN